MDFECGYLGCRVNLHFELCAKLLAERRQAVLICGPYFQKTLNVGWVHR